MAVVYVLYVQRTGHSAAQRRRIKSQFRPASGKQDTNEAHCENKSSARRRSTRQPAVAAAGEARRGEGRRLDRARERLLGGRVAEFYH